MSGEGNRKAPLRLHQQLDQVFLSKDRDAIRAIRFILKVSEKKRHKLFLVKR